MDTLEFKKSTAMEITSLNRCALKTVDPQSVVRFPTGLPGFEDAKEYVFILSDKVRPFVFMQSASRDDCCFVCIDPFLIDPQYSACVENTTVKRLGVEKEEDVEVLSIVTIDDNEKTMTANLKSPLVVNFHTLLGEQVIMENSQYSMRYDLIQAFPEEQEKIS